MSSERSKDCNVISGDLRSLFYEGLLVDGRLFHEACVGMKGDLPWYRKIAGLNRSFMRLSTLVDRPLCHECEAGSSDLPFEDVSPDSCWTYTCFSSRPWWQPRCRTIGSLLSGCSGVTMNAIGLLIACILQLKLEPIRPSSLYNHPEVDRILGMQGTFCHGSVKKS